MELSKCRILITGCAGFIGGALALRLVETTSAQIIGIDNMNDYYDVRLKEYRLKRIIEKDNETKFEFVKTDITNKQEVFEIFEKFKPDIVIHLAAQAGVRYSIENPDTYIMSNIIGFYNMLEACRYAKEKLGFTVKHFMFASSSSVYGNNEKIPYSENDNTDHPVSLYAATKKADEVIAYSYSKLYGIPMTGMRFFTVYGPAGRPDMACYGFTEKLVNGNKIELYNNGENKRDFTYIDDVVDAIVEISKSDLSAIKDEVNYRIFNIGNTNPIDTKAFVSILFKALKDVGLIKKETLLNEHIIAREKQPGDVDVTYADVELIQKSYRFTPCVSIKEGVRKFSEWYKEYLTY